LYKYLNNESLTMTLDTATPNVHEVRERLAEYIAAAQRGEEVLICRRNQPVARLVAVQAVVPPVPRSPRPLGLAPDAGQPLPGTFFEPLPEAMVHALAGTASATDAEGLSPRP
jgi:prevent-host-death family protein